ncbi:hypothetical protein [Anthocerotibacter panamensis]|uniref:hypothetical protein n=1 Tax=Anthocerotibacter panamensis TaxID=2857077 RepID=UPI001C407289|nr:hypothetical protein [Anthocerotibacter panamensis]
MRRRTQVLLAFVLAVLMGPVSCAVCAQEATSLLVTTEPFEVALARHLLASGAKLYSDPTCPANLKQRANFGAQASTLLPLIDCRSQADLCRARGIVAMPTWEIEGQLYPGVRRIHTLAVLSGFKR